MTFLTNLKLEPKGIHSTTQAYNVSDVVTSADGSVAYAAVKDVPAGIALSNAEYWVKVLDLAEVRAAAVSAAESANAAAESANTAAESAETKASNSLKYIVHDLTDPFSASGNPVQCNPVGGLIFDGLETQFSPKQAGSGDPYPGGGGKNLLPNTASSTEIYGLTYTVNADGTISVKGTCTGENVSFNIGETVLPPGEYIATAPADKKMQLWFYANGEHMLTNNYAFTLNETSVVKCNIYVSRNETYDTVLYPMIRLASDSDSTYAPYSNIRPISGYDKLTLNQAGKNLIDKDTIQPINDPWDKPTPIMTGIRITADLSLYKEPTYRTSPLKIGAIEDYMGKTVTVQAKTKASASNVPAMVLSVRTANNTSVENLTGVLTGSNIKQTVQIPDSEAYAGTYLCLVLYSNLNGACADGDYAEYTDLMLEFGSEATEYEPFKGHNTYTVQIGQTVYSGRMNWLTGELVAEWEFVELTGKENIGVYPESDLGQSLAIYNILNASAYRTTGISSHTLVHKYLDTKNRIVIGNNNRTIYWTTIADILGLYTEDEFAAWFAAQYAAGTPVQIAYKLATPTIITLTPRQIAALQGVNTLYGDGDAINVAGRQSKTLALENRIEALEAAILNT